MIDDIAIAPWPPGQNAPPPPRLIRAPLWFVFVEARALRKGIAASRRRDERHRIPMRQARHAGVRLTRRSSIGLFAGQPQPKGVEISRGCRRGEVEMLAVALDEYRNFTCSSLDSCTHRPSETRVDVAFLGFASFPIGLQCEAPPIELNRFPEHDLSRARFPSLMHKSGYPYTFLNGRLA